MPTTNRFQPGDKVRAGVFTADIGLTPSRVYTVHHVDDFGQVQPDSARHAYYHPSHFELVERASAEPAETYCLKDGDGDWWVFDADADRWQCQDRTAPWYTSRYGFERGVEHLITCHGIDAEPLPAVAGVDVSDEAARKKFERAQARVDEFIAGIAAMTTTGNSTGPSLHFEADAGAAEFKEGDRVQIVSTSATDPSHGITDGMRGVGDEFTVTEVGTNDHGPYAKCDEGYWWHPDDLELVTEPAPLKEGDAVLVWATVGEPDPDDDGDIQLGTPTGDGRNDWFHAKPDAIVRPAAGQVPPWGKAAQCTSLVAARAGSLRRCERDEHGAEMAHLLSGFGSWTTTEEAGRITERGAS